MGCHINPDSIVVVVWQQGCSPPELTVRVL